MKVEVAVLGSSSPIELTVSVDVKQHLKRIRRDEKKKKSFNFSVSVVKYTVHFLTVLQFMSSKRKRRYQNKSVLLFSSTSVYQQQKEDDEDEVMLSVLGCQMTY